MKINYAPTGYEDLINNVGNFVCAQSPRKHKGYDFLTSNSYRFINILVSTQKQNKFVIPSYNRVFER